MIQFEAGFAPSRSPCVTAFGRDASLYTQRRDAAAYGAMWASPPTERLSMVRSYNVSPSVMAKGHDTSLTEGGKSSAPAGAAGFYSARIITTSAA